MRHVRLRTSSLDAAASRRQQRRPGSRATELMFVSNGAWSQSVCVIRQTETSLPPASVLYVLLHDVVSMEQVAEQYISVVPSQATTTACATGWGGTAALAHGSTPTRPAA
jgi:hypothetical protein